MSAITDYLFDVSFVEELLAYLKTTHQINTRVVDSEGGNVGLGENEADDLSAVRYYPFEFQSNIGGLQCSAADEDLLRQAEPNIRLGLTGISNLLQREEELQQTSDEMLQLSGQLSFLFSLSRKISGISKLIDFCDVVLKNISQAIDADHAFITTIDQTKKVLNVTYNMTAEEAERIGHLEDLEKIPKTGTTIFSLPDYSILLSPLKEKDGIIGTMVFLRDQGKRFFTAYEKKFVGIIEHIISPTIETLLLYDSLQELYLNTVKALAAAIDAKDEYTHGHSFRVAKYSVAIAKILDVHGDKLRDLEIAAYMHDLGKIGISEAILGKPGKLTLEEFSEIKKHPCLTNKILRPIHLPDFIVNAAVQHHERLDGTGYPNGLKGDDISFFAKIIAVADVFDALTSKRPYRDAMPVETALKILCDGIEKEFDRTAVLALIAALQDEDKEQHLTKLHPDLKFTDVRHLNNFLVELARILLPAGGNTPWSALNIKKNLAGQIKCNLES